jgi:hypothetical protein
MGDKFVTARVYGPPKSGRAKGAVAEKVGALRRSFLDDDGMIQDTVVSALKDAWKAGYKDPTELRVTLTFGEG